MWLLGALSVVGRGHSSGKQFRQAAVYKLPEFDLTAFLVCHGIQVEHQQEKVSELERLLKERNTALLEQKEQVRGRCSYLCSTCWLGMLAIQDVTVNVMSSNRHKDTKHPASHLCTAACAGCSHAAGPGWGESGAARLDWKTQKAVGSQAGQ